MKNKLEEVEERGARGGSMGGGGGYEWCKRGARRKRKEVNRVGGDRKSKTLLTQTVIEEINTLE